MSSALASTEPGRLRRAGAGAWYVVAGGVHLLRRPGLWGHAALGVLGVSPAAFSGLVAGLYSVPRVEDLLMPGAGRLPASLDVVVTLLLWTGCSLGGLLVGAGLGLAIVTPVARVLARRLAAERTPSGTPPTIRWPQLALASLQASAVFFLAATLCVPLGLLPVGGPFLAVAWGGYFLAKRLTEPALTVAGVGFAAQNTWVRSWFWECLGFGVSGVIGLSLPVVQFAVPPALLAGGALLVLDLQAEEVSPEDVTPSTG